MVESMYTLSLNEIHRLAACRKKIMPVGHSYYVLQ